MWILVQNMVGPGEVDDELQEEVKEECAEKYGPVEKCLVYEVTARVPPEQAVRIFVQFQDRSDAEKGTTRGVRVAGVWVGFPLLVLMEVCLLWLQLE